MRHQGLPWVMGEHGATMSIHAWAGCMHAACSAGILPLDPPPLPDPLGSLDEPKLAARGEGLDPPPCLDGPPQRRRPSGGGPP